MKHKQKKFLQIVAFIILILLSGSAFWRWQTAPPRKPDRIPLGDYGYTIDYAEYRIERVMKQYHLPSTAVALIDDQLIPVSQTQFRVDHWLLHLRLEEVVPLPFDMAQLRELEVEFQMGDEADEAVMILNFSGVAYEICPKYPEFSAVPALWDEVTGAYDLVYRLPSERISHEVVGQTEILIEDNILKMAGYVGPILPINDTELIILSGLFAGETMVYEPDTGYIYHQSIVYKPSN